MRRGIANLTDWEPSRHLSPAWLEFVEIWQDSKRVFLAAGAHCRRRFVPLSLSVYRFISLFFYLSRVSFVDPSLSHPSALFAPRVIRIGSRRRKKIANYKLSLCACNFCRSGARPISRAGTTISDFAWKSVFLGGASENSNAYFDYVRGTCACAVSYMIRPGIV